jgi:hypothetical protein
VLIFGGETFFDLNHDGINDFGIFATAFGIGAYPPFSLRLDAQGKNSFQLGTKRGYRFYPCAAALPGGAKVGPKAPFRPGHGVMYYHDSGPSSRRSCSWVYGKTAYLGLKFAIKGKTHFGWARVVQS